MSTLNSIEKAYFEKLFGMSSGYVLNYSDATFATFFCKYNIEIHSEKYQTNGTSKAKKLRAFWEQERDVLVGKVLGKMLEEYEASCVLKDEDADVSTLKKAREIVLRLVGGSTSHNIADSVDNFLKNEISLPKVQNLPVEAIVIPIIESRLSEARDTMKVGAYLATVLLCGSILEAILLGAAQKEIFKFNQAQTSPKDKNNKVKRLNEWTLSQLIDVATEVGLLKPDVKKFSHALRDFRNYIHPYQQMMSDFTPDKYTAEICFQVLKVALVSVAGERN